MKNATCGLLVLLIWVSSRIGWGQMIPQRPPTDLDKKIQTFLSASIDLARLRLSGPSYEYTPGLNNLRNHPGDVLVLNLAIKFNNQGMINQIFNYYNTQSYRTPIPADPATLLAANTNLPGPTSPADKPPFLSHVSLLYGFQLIGKGGKDEDGYGTSKTRMTYLETMGYALYNYDLPNSKGRLFGGPGIYLGYGLWGKTSYTYQGGSDSFAAFDKLNGYRRFDAGVALTAGYQLEQGLRLSLEYEVGLLNINPGAGDDKTKNRSLSLNIAYPLKAFVDKLRKK
ncbi:PorT family protein [Spirosoma sp. KCTC 42546]|uniref:outer membrane beta-barrel protein n=1 Tax=Spirosoma sp. KCTC 42546 TaxID=2520506 RepID=UPI00115829B4|nr:outer membrane beta-barrel protein [Spirosoma sp. KCTC 42546]QDK82835.1 PorT family protein [Spirosoma sp. KCTC 42546]